MSQSKKKKLGALKEAFLSAMLFVPSEPCGVCNDSGAPGMAEDSCPRCGRNPEEGERLRALRAFAAELRR